MLRESNERIDAALRQNRRQEHLIIGVLVALFAVGLGLIVYGAAIQAWGLLAPGGILHLAIVFPIRRLIKLREENIRLQIIPQLLRLADTEDAKRLVSKLINRLIEQV